MTIAELLLPEWDNEMKVTRNVLAGVPDDRAEWKPHPRAFPMAHLAQLVARLPAWVPMVMDKHELDIAPKEGSTFPGYSIEKTSDLLELFDRNAALGRDAIAKGTDDAFNEPWTLKKGGETVMTQPRYMIMRSMMLNHIVHHRAQLGLYLRMTDQCVPEMYGPTADSRK